MSELAETADKAVEAKERDRTVALIIAILALMLALAEAGAKKAQHLSTEKNIEASDLYNFYQAKKIRSTVVETASKMLEAQSTGLADPEGAGGGRETDRGFQDDRRQLREGPQEARGQPRRDSGTGDSGEGSARTGEPPARALRAWKRPHPDRDRARVSRDHHRHLRPHLAQRRPRRHRRHSARVRLLRPDRAGVYGVDATPKPSPACGRRRRKAPEEGDRPPPGAPPGALHFACKRCGGSPRPDAPRAATARDGSTGARPSVTV